MEKAETESSDIKAQEAKKRLRNGLDELATVCGFAMNVSQLLTGEPTTRSGELASMVHAKMCANTRSIGHLATSPLFDHSAIMAIARMVIDEMTMYFYLREVVSKEEWELRDLVLNLHDTVARIKLLRAWQSKVAHADLRTARDRLVRRLKANAIFCTMKPEQQSKLLCGEEIFVGGMRAAAGRAGWSEDTFISIYNYFSAHVHGAPMSYVRMRQHHTDFLAPSPAQFDSANFALIYARSCMLRATLDYVDTSAAGAADKMQQELLASWRKEDKETKIFTAGK